MTFEGRRLTIREATGADASGIAAVHIYSWQWAYRGQLPDEFLDGLTAMLPRREQQWSEWMKEPATNATWVACLDDQIVGFVHVGHARRSSGEATQDSGLGAQTGEVWSIYMLKEAAGLGIGRRLFARGTKVLKAHGYQDAVLWVLKTNERARRFYEAAGWGPDGNEQPISIAGVGVTEVRYRGTL